MALIYAESVMQCQFSVFPGISVCQSVMEHANYLMTTW